MESIIRYIGPSTTTNTCQQGGNLAISTVMLMIGVFSHTQISHDGSEPARFITPHDFRAELHWY